MDEKLVHFCVSFASNTQKWGKHFPTSKGTRPRSEAARPCALSQSILEMKWRLFVATALFVALAAPLPASWLKGFTAGIAAFIALSPMRQQRQRHEYYYHWL